MKACVIVSSRFCKRICLPRSFFFFSYANLAQELAHDVHMTVNPASNCISIIIFTDECIFVDGDSQSCYSDPTLPER